MGRVPAAERKKQFIVAAIGVIAERGCEGATTRRIAERAGAPLASLHYCFSSKEELFFSIFEDLVQEQLGRSLQIRPLIGLGRASSLLLQQMLAWGEKEADFGRAQLELYFWVVRQDSDFARTAYERALDLVSSLLTQALRPEDDRSLVGTFARILVAFADGAVVQNMVFDDVQLRASTIDTLAESLERLAESHRMPAVSSAG